MSKKIEIEYQITIRGKVGSEMQDKWIEGVLSQMFIQQDEGRMMPSIIEHINANHRDNSIEAIVKRVV